MNNPHQFNSNGYTCLPYMYTVQPPEPCKFEPKSRARKTLKKPIRVGCQIKMACALNPEKANQSKYKLIQIKSGKKR